ncbi:MAG: SDR family NAD(P)-dependent oxidoreductase, partial [Beijerinckiaceae bacterium]
MTGAAQGFGFAIAETFVREGARVALMDLQADKVAEAASTIGHGAIALSGDVSKAVDTQAAVDAAIKAFGHVDILVNNAGTSHRNRPMIEVSEDEFDRVFAVNVKSIYQFARAIVPHMRSRGGGVILNIGSTAGIR